MTRSQFIFSLTSGAAAMSGGYWLAAAAVADWGLFWVGSSITAMAVFTAVKANLPEGSWSDRSLALAPVER